MCGSAVLILISIWNTVSLINTSWTGEQLSKSGISICKQLSTTYWQLETTHILCFTDTQLSTNERRERARSQSGEADTGGGRYDARQTLIWANHQHTISLLIGMKGGVQTISHVLVSKANGLDNPPFNAPPSDRCKFVVVVSDGI